jgi:hypothetical protein
MDLEVRHCRPSHGHHQSRWQSHRSSPCAPARHLSGAHGCPALPDPAKQTKLGEMPEVPLGRSNIDSDGVSVLRRRNDLQSGQLLPARKLVGA